MSASDEASLLPPEISRYLPGLYMMKFGNKEMSLDMNKNSRFASYRNIILFTLLTALMLMGVYRVIRWKDTTGNYISSYDELYHTPENTIDVAFLGSSHCYAGIYPAVMWEDRGVTSFDMAVSGQDKDSCYHALIELLKTQKPQVVFADLYALTFEEHAFIGNVYRNLLSMRTSSNSVQLVTAYAEKEDQKDFILRWPIVHTRYRELQPYDFLKYPLNDFGRGAAYDWEHTDVSWSTPCTDTGLSAPLSDSNRQWLDQMIRLSEKKGFRLVFTILPYDVSEDDRAVYNTVTQYAGDAGIDVIDFSLLENEISLDRREDFRDAGHLNGFGAAKITRYLEAYLDTLPQEQYLEVDRRTDAACAIWNRDLSWMNQTKFRYALDNTDNAQDFCALLAQTDGITAILSLEDTGNEHALPEGALSFEELLPALKPLGFNTEIASPGGKWLYHAGELTKLHDNDDKEEAFSMDLGPAYSLRVQYNGDFAAGNLMIGLTDYSHRDRRLQIVLYDSITDEVIGSYCF